MKSVFLVIVVASMTSSLRCPSQWAIYNSNCYRYYQGPKKNFWQASSFCRQQLFYSSKPKSKIELLHSELVSIHNLGENTFVNSLVPSRINVYIGLYQKLGDGQRTWHWTDGTLFDYSNWSPGQPDPSLQAYTTLWNSKFPSKWDDADWPGGLGFVCKIPADDCLTTLNEFINDDEDCKNGGNLLQTTCVCSAPYACIDCSWYNGCASNPCQNGGTCKNREHSYACECSKGFTGTHCEIYSGCLAFPCMNDGNCTKDPDKSIFICTCPEDYTGVTCQTYIGHCKENPCENEASCHSISVAPFYVCQCKPPYVGNRCTATSYDCLNNPCLHGGTCIPNKEANTTSCMCSSDYSGSTCGVQKRTETSSIANSQSNTNLIVTFIVVTTVLTLTILLMVGYIRRIKRHAERDSTSFVGLQNNLD